MARGEGHRAARRHRLDEPTERARRGMIGEDVDVVDDDGELEAGLEPIAQAVEGRVRASPVVVDVGRRAQHLVEGPTDPGPEPDRIVIGLVEGDPRHRVWLLDSPLRQERRLAEARGCHDGEHRHVAHPRSRGRQGARHDPPGRPRGPDLGALPSLAWSWGMGEVEQPASELPEPPGLPGEGRRGGEPAVGSAAPEAERLLGCARVFLGHGEARELLELHTIHRRRVDAQQVPPVHGVHRPSEVLL